MNKYVEIASELENCIKAGKYQDRLPGVYRLAKEFGVSHITISKAIKHLAQKGYVNILGTKGTLITYSEERRPRTNIIGIIGNFSEINQNNIPIKTIVEQASKKGVKTVSFSIHQQEILNDDNFLDAFYVDGFIFMYSSLTSEVIGKLKRRGIPIVSMNRLPKEFGVNCVDHGNAEGWMALYRKLLKMGHRRVACLAGKAKDQIHQNDFERAYRDAMNNGGVYDPLLFAGDFDAEMFAGDSREEKLKRFIQDKISFFFSLKEPPTAVFCKSPFILETTRQICGERNIELKLVTEVEENDLKDNSFFPVSVWSEDKRAKKAFDVLYDLIQRNIEPPVDHHVERKLVMR